MLKKNCFPYETAFENFRDEEVSEEVINSFLYDSEPMEENDITEQKIKSIKYADFAKLSEYLAMYFALNNTCSDSDLLEENNEDDDDIAVELPEGDISEGPQEIDPRWNELKKLINN